MCISPIGFYFDNLEEIDEEATYAIIPSHNTKEAITKAVTVAHTIYLARNKCSKKYIKNYIEKKFNYDLNFNLESLRKNYKFSSLTSKTVPQAIYCFLISNSFDNAIRIGASIGGDTNTIGAIIGSITEAYYGIDENLKN